MTATDEQTRRALLACGTAAVFEALERSGDLPREIGPLWTPLAVAGPAYTVTTKPADNLALHRAVAEAPSRVVIVASTSGPSDVAVFGDLLARIAVARGIAGLVIDAPVRDRDRIRAIRFPVFCTGGALMSPTKQFPGVLQQPVELGAVTICPGDWIVADGDGVVAIAEAQLAETLSAAEAVGRKEEELVRRAVAERS